MNKFKRKLLYRQIAKQANTPWLHVSLAAMLHQGGLVGEAMAACKVLCRSNDGADVLPVFDPTGTMMMWTGQRDPKGTSQLWIAPFSFAEHRPSAVPAGAYGRGS